MAFYLPIFTPPDFTQPHFLRAPKVVFEKVVKKGSAPPDYHATSIYPEYFQIRKGTWRLPEESRMDCVVVLDEQGRLAVKEFRHLKKGDQVALGRRENGEDGIFVHTGAFGFPEQQADKFAFRTRITRETSFSIDYDELYELLEYERRKGFVLWVLGPAVVFDHDAREAFVGLIERGYVHGLLAGNALAVHDVEGAIFGTALGQEIYSKKAADLGHYKHLDAINRIRATGSLRKAVQQGEVKNGVMRAVLRKKTPYVLAGSIRDDGPLPEVIPDVYKAQDKMRCLTAQSTTVIAMATQLHAIATGNMVPSYRVLKNGQIRPV
ncbi:MAG: hypothetical protein C0407_09050, partial [Desulfobacca sp.]|nr:hypothetical protein [Desulfobacca sp.]